MIRDYPTHKRIYFLYKLGIIPVAPLGDVYKEIEQEFKTVRTIKIGIYKCYLDDRDNIVYNTYTRQLTNFVKINYSFWTFIETLEKKYDIGTVESEIITEIVLRHKGLSFDRMTISTNVGMVSGSDMSNKFEYVRNTHGSKYLNK